MVSLVQVLAPVVFLVAATLTPGVHAQKWRRLCQDVDGLQMNFTAVQQGPSGNQPRVTFNRSDCSLIVQPCTLRSCENNVPAVIIDITMPSAPFDAMWGSFIERGDIGDDGADDCDPEHEGTPALWSRRASMGHGGITMFGTPEQVLYRGCEAEMDFEFFSWPFGVTELSQVTNRIRFESHQSIGGKIVMLLLGNIIVRRTPPSTFISPDGVCENNPMDILPSPALYGPAAITCARLAESSRDGCNTTLIHRDNLVRNGGFERPQLPDDTCLGDETNTTSYHWGLVGADSARRRDGGCVLVRGEGPNRTWTYGGSGPDTQAFALSNSCMAEPSNVTNARYGGIQQYLRLIPGRRYRLSFSMTSGQTFSEGRVKVVVFNNTADGRQFVLDRVFDTNHTVNDLATPEIALTSSPTTSPTVPPPGASPTTNPTARCSQGLCINSTTTSPIYSPTTSPSVSGTEESAWTGPTAKTYTVGTIGTYDHATAWCEARGGVLAMPKSEAENDAAWAACSDMGTNLNTRCWIGLERERYQNWSWADGSNITWDAWDANLQGVAPEGADLTTNDIRALFSYWHTWSDSEITGGRNTHALCETVSPGSNWDNWEVEFEVPAINATRTALPQPRIFNLLFEVGWDDDDDAVFNASCVYIDEVAVWEVWEGWQTTVGALCPAYCEWCNQTLNDTGRWVEPTCNSTDTHCQHHLAEPEPACVPVFGQCGGVDWTGPTECDADSVCIYSQPKYSQCLFRMGLNVWADCTTDADCAGNLWCGDAVCRPSGLCNINVPANDDDTEDDTEEITDDRTPQVILEVQDLIAAGFENGGGTINVTTPAYSTLIEPRNCSGLRRQWSPPSSVTPSEQSSIVINEFAAGDPCRVDSSRTVVDRPLAFVWFAAAAASLAGIAVVNEPGFAVSGPVFALASRDNEIGLSSVGFTLDLNGTVGESYMCAHCTMGRSDSVGWTGYGCTQENVGLIYTCQCTVNSSTQARRDLESGGIYFTVLVGDETTVDSRSPTEKTHAVALLWVTYFGLGISVPSMLAFVYLYVRHTELRTQHRFNIANLCAVLSVLMLLFVFGIAGDANTAGCTAIAFLLHYLLLSAFCWMLLDGWFQYRTFVHVFKAHRTPPNLKQKALLAYLGPLLLCTMTISVWEDDYGYVVFSTADDGTSVTTQDVCFIDPKSDARYGFFVPIILVLFANVLFFAAVLHVVVSAPVLRSVKKKMIPPRTARALKASLMFLPTLGFSWMFGLVAVELDDNDARLVFTWLFTVLTVVQGAIIFWFHLYQDREARQKLKFGDFFSNWAHGAKQKKQKQKAVLRGRNGANWFPKQTPSNEVPTDSTSSGLNPSAGRSGLPPAYEHAPGFGPPSCPSSSTSEAPFCHPKRSSSLPTVVSFFASESPAGRTGTPMRRSSAFAVLPESPMPTRLQTGDRSMFPVQPPDIGGDGNGSVDRTSKGGEYLSSVNVSTDAEYITAYPASQMPSSSVASSDGSFRSRKIRETVWEQSVRRQMSITSSPNSTLDRMPCPAYYGEGTVGADSMRRESVRGVSAESWTPATIMAAGGHWQSTNTDLEAQSAMPEPDSIRIQPLRSRSNSSMAIRECRVAPGPIALRTVSPPLPSPREQYFVAVPSPTDLQVGNRRASDTLLPSAAGAGVRVKDFDVSILVNRETQLTAGEKAAGPKAAAPNAGQVTPSNAPAAGVPAARLASRRSSLV